MEWYRRLNENAAILIDRIHACVASAVELGLDGSHLTIDPVMNWAAS
jgi:hypothetical protein